MLTRIRHLMGKAALIAISFGLFVLGLGIAQLLPDRLVHRPIILVGRGCRFRYLLEQSDAAREAERTDRRQPKHGRDAFVYRTLRGYQYQCTANGRQNAEEVEKRTHAEPMTARRAARERLFDQALPQSLGNHRLVGLNA